MSKLQLHKVLRPIFIGGERIDVDALVELGPVLGAELRAAGKVERASEGEPAAQAKDRESARVQEPAPRVRKAKTEAQGQTQAGAAPAEGAGASQPPSDPAPTGEA